MFFPSSPFARRAAQVGAVLFTLLCWAIMHWFVDLKPKVDSNFFFASDDPQFQAQKKIDKLFYSSPQIILTVEGDIRSPDYWTRVHEITSKIAGLDSVLSVKSLTNGPENLQDAIESPLWSRLLLAEDKKSSNIIVTMDKNDNEETIERIITLKERADKKGFRVAISGVPYVVYEIQHQLVKELTTFGITAFILFTVLVILIFRSLWILAGSIVSCLTSCFLTFITLEIIGMEPGILTANLWSIVFVLTLEHTVFFTANWEIAASAQPGRLGETSPRRGGQEKRGTDAQIFAAAVRLTGPASFWAMFATVLGFVALLGGSARPLFQFGIAGAIGAVIAMGVAYAIYPVFLASARRPESGPRGTAKPWPWIERCLSRPNKIVFAVTALLCIGALPGLFKFNIDPQLFSYFKPGGRMRTDLERIDRQGGISPLEIVIRDENGAKFTSTEQFKKLWQLQAVLEKDPAVGAVISLPVLMAEGDRAPLSFLISWEGLLQRMEQPEYGKIAKGFVTSDREQSRFLLRIKESERKGSREEVVNRLKKTVRDHGFEPVLVGGLYHLQGQLSSSLAFNLLQGIVGLIVFFCVIAWIVARSWKVALAMIACLCIMPFTLLGAVSYFGIPLDIVSAPSVDLAIGIGVDTMIHLVSFIRGSKKTVSLDWKDWADARLHLWKPITVSSLIIAIGFGVLLLSDYPPTQRLGILVSVGTLLWVVLTLFVLPTAIYFLNSLKQGLIAHCAGVRSKWPCRIIKLKDKK